MVSCPSAAFTQTRDIPPTVEHHQYKISTSETVAILLGPDTQVLGHFPIADHQFWNVHGCSWQPRLTGTLLRLSGLLSVTRTSRSSPDFAPQDRSKSVPPGSGQNQHESLEESRTKAKTYRYQPAGIRALNGALPLSNTSVLTYSVEPCGVER
ncbi:hypothetical protein BC835DRAFT_149290 [Cytidiella melzeri]|nr:hypothetical protein BC835DRAFT_149290 [Cytidiella melzeri]